MDIFSNEPAVPDRLIHLLTLHPGDCFRFPSHDRVYRVAKGPQGEYLARPAVGVGLDAKIMIEQCFVYPCEDPTRASEANDDEVS